MDDCSWMYRDSPQGLRMMDYCNGVQGFFNFTTSIPRNFTRGGIRCPCRKCLNKKYLHLDVVMMHLLHKGFMEITCVGRHTENYFFVIIAWKKGWLGQLLVLATCIELQMTTVILTWLWLWMQWEWIKVMSVNVQS